MGKRKAIIFDLDGTLLNTLDDLADSMNRVLQRMGFPVHPVDAYRYFVGDGIETFAWRVLPEENRDKNTVTACVVDMLDEYGEHWQDKTRPYDEIGEMLTALLDRKLKLAILSNKPDALTQIAVSAFLSSWNFDVVAGVVNGVPKKPDPAGALNIAGKLNLSGNDILYLGDTGTDMLTAQRAGMFAIGALWGFRDAEELQKNGACALIERPLDILNYT